MKILFQIIFLTFLFNCQNTFAQASCNKNDTIINNLVHTKGYKTSKVGSIPKFIKTGKGSQTLILIPGLGFDHSVFKDFIEANKNNYTMYAITIPGFGKTQAPPMPDSLVSYGEQTWTKSTIDGILKLMEKEKLNKPVLVGHFTLGTQIALRIAINRPDKVSGVIVMGGQAKFIAIQQGKVIDYSLKQLIIGADKYSAPVMFKGKKEKDWDDGNYTSEIYSLKKDVGNILWQQVAGVPVPVMVRYLCEFIASDIKAELDKIGCPVLVFRPSFNSALLDSAGNNYVKPQFIDTWNGATEKNKLITVLDVNNSGCFVWKDQPTIVTEETKKFIDKIK